MGKKLGTQSSNAQSKVTNQRKEKEAERKGGRSTKINAAVLASTKEVLLRHSKPESKLAHVTKNPEGTFSAHRARGSQQDSVVVPSQSLLQKPARIFKEKTSVSSKMSRSTLYKMLRGHFADFLLGQRRADICSHCQCYWREIVPRFHRDWKKIQSDLVAVYPQYFQHFVQSRGSILMQVKKLNLHWLTLGVTHGTTLRNCDCLVAIDFVCIPSRKLRRNCS